MSTRLTDHTTTVPATSAQPAGTGPAAPRRRELRSRIGAAETLRQSLTVAWRNVMQIRHTPEKLLDVILMPAVFLVLFLYVFGGAVAGSTHAYLEQLLPGLVAMMAMFATMGLGTSLCDDIRKGVFGSASTCQLSSPVWPMSARRAPAASSRSSSASWSRSVALTSMCSRSLPLLGSSVWSKTMVGCGPPKPASGGPISMLPSTRSSST